MPNSSFKRQNAAWGTCWLHSVLSEFYSFLLLRHEYPTWRCCELHSGETPEETIPQSAYPAAARVLHPRAARLCCTSISSSQNIDTKTTHIRSIHMMRVVHTSGVAHTPVEVTTHCLAFSVYPGTPTRTAQGCPACVGWSWTLDPTGIAEQCPWAPHLCLFLGGFFLGNVPKKQSSRPEFFFCAEWRRGLSHGIKRAVPIPYIHWWWGVFELLLWVTCLLGPVHTESSLC